MSSGYGVELDSYRSPSGPSYGGGFQPGYPPSPYSYNSYQQPYDSKPSLGMPNGYGTAPSYGNKEWEYGNLGGDQPYDQPTEQGERFPVHKEWRDLPFAVLFFFHMLGIGMQSPIYFINSQLPFYPGCCMLMIFAHRYQLLT